MVYGLIFFNIILEIFLIIGQVSGARNWPERRLVYTRTGLLVASAMFSNIIYLGCKLIGLIIIGTLFDNLALIFSLLMLASVIASISHPDNSWPLKEKKVVKHTSKHDNDNTNYMDF